MLIFQRTLTGFEPFADMKLIRANLYMHNFARSSAFHRLHLLYSHKLRALFFNLVNFAVYACIWRGAIFYRKLDRWYSFFSHSFGEIRMEIRFE